MHWLMVNDISMDAIGVCAAMVSPVSSLSNSESSLNLKRLHHHSLLQSISLECGYCSIVIRVEAF